MSGPGGMRCLLTCPHCGGSETMVTDSRYKKMVWSSLSEAIRRTRRCRDCGQSFTTHEFASHELREMGFELNSEDVKQAA